VTKIVVIGGAGYIGSQTVKQLIADGFSVVVIDSLENGHQKAVNKKAKLEIANLDEEQKIRKILKSFNPDAIIDFAAYLSVGESMNDPARYLENNVYNFIKLLDIASEVDCKYLIKSSTAAVYGNPTKESDIPWGESFTDNYIPKESALLEGLWNGKKLLGEAFFQKVISEYEKELGTRKDLSLTDEEKNKLRIPLSVYGLTKLLDEILLEKYNRLSGIKSVALRYFNVCGADPDGDIGEDKPNPTTLMILAIYQAMGKLPLLKLFGRDYPTPDGTAIRDYIHPLDLALGHIAALKHLLSGGCPEVFNLGTGKGSSVLEVISAVEKVSGKKLKIRDFSRRSGDPTISVADPSKAEKKLNWQAKYALSDMAATAWHWHSKNPTGFDGKK
jgi:UDP-glucose 4-epimerase